MRSDPKGHDTHVFVDADGNRHHLGGVRSRQTGARFKGRVFSVPLQEIPDGSIEAGLIALKAWAQGRPPTMLSRREIGYVCGCSESMILQIEQKALKKLRKYGIKQIEGFAR